MTGVGATVEDQLVAEQFQIFVQGGLVHGIAGRKGGVSEDPFASLNLSLKTGDDQSAVRENRRRVEALIKLPRFRVVAARLTHGHEVAVFKLGGLIPPLSPPVLGWPAFDADAAVSDVPGVILMMTFADCVPILFSDADHDACGLAHSGWRGTAQRIASRTVRRMTEVFGTEPSKLSAAIGPSIGPCCYEVGAEVRDAIEQAYGESAEDLISASTLDLWQANVTDLISAGVPAQQIEVSKTCTSCNVDRFFSHRREAGKTGRFGAWIGVTDPDG